MRRPRLRPPSQPRPRTPGAPDPTTMASNPTPATADAPPLLRSVVGGFLMGLANLVPGVSGGTMILAIGLYDRFIDAVASLSRLKFQRNILVFCALVAVGLAVAILGFSGPAVHLVGTHRWAMYSLFIGMTLGGVPALWRASRPLDAATVPSMLAGFAVMAALAFALQESSLPHTIPVFLGMGALAASSMILPGVSGSYILLIFGMYDVVVGAVSSSALREDPTASLQIIVPVGVGAVLGIGLLSNLLKGLLERAPRASHAGLLGLLAGSVLGLYPFQEAVHPDLVHKPTRKAVEVLVVEGGTLEEARAELEGDALAAFTDAHAAELTASWHGSTKGDLKRASVELRRFDPSPKRIGAALGLLILGFLLTLALGGRGGDGESSGTNP